MGTAIKPNKAFASTSPGSATTAARADGAVLAASVMFTETTGAGTYTGAVAIPAGATIVDIIVDQQALWAATTSASLEVGDAADPDGFYTAVDLKATDLLAGESLSFSHAGAERGAYFTGTNTHVNPRRTTAARTITATVVTVGAAGATGRTLVTVLYVSAGTATAATKA